MFSNSFFKVFSVPINNLLNNLPWSDWIEKAVYVFWKQIAVQGMYQVQEYESTLELLDATGNLAKFHKRQRVRYLQDHIIAYQDQAWGDGRILQNYRCSPGVPVDRYQLGFKTLILISLREVKRRGDIDEFNIEWEIRNGFRKKQESWETEISHRTKRLQIRIIFPVARPPLKRICIEASSQNTFPIIGEFQRQLPDGRSQIIFEIIKPRVNERYIVKWDW